MQKDFSRLVRMSDVKQMVGLSRKAIGDRIKNETFPSPVRHSERIAFWYEDEIQNWMKAVMGGYSEKELKALCKEMMEARMTGRFTKLSRRGLFGCR